jgi:CBS domain-containing protein
MFVREIMTRHAETVGADETLESAARKMKELGIGALPVLDRGQLSGIVTDRDLATRAVASGADPTRAHVRDVMTAQVIACREDDDVEEAARTMEERAIRRIMVLDREGDLSGMLSVDDLVCASMALAADVLRHAREPELSLS